MSKLGRWTKQVSHSTKEIVRDVSNVLSGYREFKKNGATPEVAYMSMRRLYRVTNGRFNDAVGGLCKTLHPKQSTDLSTSLFGDVTKKEVRDIAMELRKNGCYKFERQMPAELCQQLLRFSLTTPGTGISLDSLPPVPQLFDRENPSTVRHQFQAGDLFENETVQEIATDPYFFSIAQDYLGFNPILDLMSMWWSAPGDAALQSRAAQQYHFDMDRFRFVKFFVYLTDVDANNGPHCYVRGSHVRKPPVLLRDERIMDQEIEAHYRPTDIREFTGPVGTLLAVDTRGFHKGKPLTARDRLIFEIQFADSMFGQNYAPVSVTENITKKTRQRLQQNRRCYSNFELPGV